MFRFFCFAFVLTFSFGCSPAIVSIESYDSPDSSLPLQNERKGPALNIVVLPFGYYMGYENLNQNPFKQFERDVMRNLQHNFKNKELKFFTEAQAKADGIKADQFLKLSVDQFTPGAPMEIVNVEQLSKTIETGRNSQGIPTYSTVRATLTITERTSIAQGDIDVQITDSAGKNLFKDHFVSENTIKTTFYNIKGDSRAMDGSFLGLKKDPGQISQLEPFLKQVSNELDYKLKMYYNDLKE